MPTSLVIVESPAKARTIGRFLGDDFVVEASIGAIRDLDPKGLAVDIDDDFKPSYVVPNNKKDVVKKLRAALARVDQLYLATDEDREGEAIAWHLTEVLKPRVPMRRMVFHEITRQAIEQAVQQSRDIDKGLVDAQEARRIVDRLFGYPVSEVLWRKISPGLSAGRVQSPAVRLVVERERERMAFVAADYWGLQALFPTGPSFTAGLTRLDDARVATGKDFDPRGALVRNDAVALDEVSARALVAGLAGVVNGSAAALEEPVTATARFTVASVDEKPYRSSPKPPFITSTLQQEGGRKLGMSASQVMSTAQGLYERGYITYMRTDSTTLSDEAIAAARAQINELYGAKFLPQAPRVYRKKVKNAQEAHEAIRPAGDRWRTPEQLSGDLRGADLRLYDLIWKRTVASQMADATGKSLSARIEAPLPAATLSGTAVATALAEIGATGSLAGTVTTHWSASGRTITFPGYLRVYVEGSDDPDADLDDRERPLPPLAAGEALPAPGVESQGHSTQPPARYTEASLIKKLEELGIGRPSTYASIMQTIQGRGYVWRKGQALVPSWTAFAVVNLLEGHFSAEVGYSFTAQMEDDLDEIAVGARERSPFLRGFWFGDPVDGDGASPGAEGDGRGQAGPGADGDGSDDGSEGGTVGLTTLIDLAMANADPAAVNAIPLGKDPEGNEVVVRNGKYGPYVRRGEDTASVPDDLAPDELTVERALELLAAPKGDTPIGTDPASGLPVYAKSGRYGPYVQLGDAETLPEGQKPKMSSLFKTMTPQRLTLDDALQLLSLPRVVGTHPESGEPIEALNGRYGPYVRMGKESRSLVNEEQLFTVTLDEALRLLAEPKRGGRGAAAAPPLRELGDDPVSGKPVVVKNGRYGPYVTDGETNASLREREGDAVESITIERAADLLQARRDAGPSTPRRRGAKKAAAKKTAAKKSTAKKAVAKKTAAKKTATAATAAKKSVAKKSAAAKATSKTAAKKTAAQRTAAREGSDR
jgi:DNA topoisomerase-1